MQLKPRLAGNGTAASTSAGERYEGHGGGDDQRDTMKRSRGTFLGVGAFAPLSQDPRSVNSKSGGMPPANKFD